MKTFADYNIHVQGTGETDTTCPECSPTRKKKHDKCLSVNIDLGTWYCHHCGWSGGIGGDGTQPRWVPPIKKMYERPKDETPEEILNPKSREWLHLRGISDEVIERNKIRDGLIFMPQVNKEVNAIQFPYYRNGELINIKYRDGQKNFRSVKGAERIIFGYDDIAYDCILVITEGEMDKLSCDVAGYTNSISIPDGAPDPESKNIAIKFKFLETCDEVLRNVTHFIIAVDNDEPGKFLESELARRLGVEKCSRVEWPAGCKDANDVLCNYGAGVLKGCLDNAIPYPIKGIYSPMDLPIVDLYDNGHKSGISTGWDSVDRHWTLSREYGQLNIVTGVPGHGKSEWLDALMINLCDSEQWTFGIFSPENFPLEEHAGKLIEKEIGLPFREGFKRRLTREQVKVGQAWLSEYVDFILPDEDHLSVDAVLHLAKALVYRKGINGLIIDPWNELDHTREPNQNETEYISAVLTKFRRFARRNRCQVFIVAHPTKLYRDKEGNYPIPTPYDISGSAHWRNKADNCITVWRDLEAEGDDKFKVDIHIQKVRVKHLGAPGVAQLNYEYSTGRYKE